MLSLGGAGASLWISWQASVLGQLDDRVGDVVHLRKDRLLEGGLVGDPRVGCRDAAYWCVERVEQVVRRPCRHLGAEAAGEHVLVHDEEASSATHGLAHDLVVPRRERPEVHDLDRDAVALLDDLRRLA